MNKTQTKYVQFTFPWWWIKDKQIIHRGNEYWGTLIIADSEGKMVKMYGYEAIDTNYKNKE